MLDNDLDRRIAFASLSGVNITTGARLLSATGGLNEFFDMDETALKAVTGTRSKIASRSVRDAALDKASRECRFVMGHNINPTFFTDAAYPKRLAECEDAPAMLYSLGSCNLESKYMLGIVGTRHATPYGIDFIRRLIAELAENMPEKPVIVSGLAYGVDIVAHKAAMAEGCPTIAVLAHGLKTIYPGAHRKDASDIVARGGALVTEYCSDAPVHKGNFLARNRIVAGLCDGLLVVESAERGGALVTARLAAGYHREVMALPGRISDEYSKGCNALIRKNIASLVTCAADVAEVLGWHMRQPEGMQAELPLELSDEEQQVVDYLREVGEAPLDRIALQTGLGITRTMSLLVDMEFRGIVLCYPGARYRLS